MIDLGDRAFARPVAAGTHAGEHRPVGRGRRHAVLRRRGVRGGSAHRSGAHVGRRGVPRHDAPAHRPAGADRPRRATTAAWTARPWSQRCTTYLERRVADLATEVRDCAVRPGTLSSRRDPPCHHRRRRLVPAGQPDPELVLRIAGRHQRRVDRGADRHPIQELRLRGHRGVGSGGRGGDERRWTRPASWPSTST